MQKPHLRSFDLPDARKGDKSVRCLLDELIDKTDAEVSRLSRAGLHDHSCTEVARNAEQALWTLHQLRELMAASAAPAARH